MRLAKALISTAFVAFATAAAADAYDLGTPVGTMAADPAAAAVLNKDIPGLLSNENYSSFKFMNLKQLASLSGGRMTKSMLSQTESDLKALPRAGVQKIAY